MATVTPDEGGLLQLHAVGEASGSPWSSPTEIERRVLGLLVDGADGRRIASELQISRSEAGGHIQSLLSKLNVNSRLEAATMAVSAGILGQVSPRPISVLIVDDHELFAEAIEATLSDAGIDTAASLGEVRRHRVCGRARPRRGTARPRAPRYERACYRGEILEGWPDAKLVALTGLDDPAAISGAIAIGFRGYLKQELAR